MVSNQITKFQNSKKLIEFLDKMNAAAPDAYAHLHAGQEKRKDGEQKTYSLIGVLILDYSAGTGEENTKRAEFNLSPGDIRQISKNISREINKVFIRGAFSYEYRQNALLIRTFFCFALWLEGKVKDLFLFLGSKLSLPLQEGQPKEELAFSQSQSVNMELGKKYSRDPYSEKKESVVYTAVKLIAASKDESGRSPMTKITVKRCPMDGNGKPRLSPWQISIEKGTALAEQTGTGAYQAKRGSYQSDLFLYVWLTDDEIEKQFRIVCDYIRVFENTFCYQSMKAGRAALRQEREAKGGAHG